MSVINFESVYVILGIDIHENDRVLCVCRTYDEAKRFCIELGSETEYYDLWVEKHAIL